MSTFSDELRSVIAKKAEQLHVEDYFRQRKRETTQRQQDETASAAAMLVRDVFRPLLEEFFLVLEAAGVLCGGVVEEDRTQGYLCRLRAVGTAPPGAHYEIRVSCMPDETGRIEAAVECLDTMAADREEMKSEAGSQESEEAAAWTALFAEEKSGVRSQESEDTTSAPPLPAPFSPLLTLPKKTFRAAGIDHDAARRWCADLLKKCGQALIVANRG